MDDSQLTSLDRDVLRTIGDLDVNGLRAGAETIAGMTRAEGSEAEQGWEEAVRRLSDSGLVRRTFLGNYRLTRAGLDLLRRLDA